MKLSENLKKLRKENNLSQEQLAEKLGVSRQAVSKWESGQSYPEMDKVLLICKLFNYNIDELMNENIKEVEASKQSKININKYVEDFFGFITKTVEMLCNMKFKQLLKCILEQIIVVLIISIILGIIGGIGSEIISRLFWGNSGIYYLLRNIFETIFIVLGLVIGTTIFLHIFKIRYLDYYEIVKEEDKERNTLNTEEKIKTEKNKEKIVIRDPKHSESNFLNGIIKVVLICIKIAVAFYSIIAIFTFIALIVLLILSFMFIKTGLLFIGVFLGIISALAINFIILELFYNFIVSKKCQKTRMAVTFLAALILAGIGIGTAIIGFTTFEFIDETEEKYQIEDTYTIQMSEELSFYGWYNQIEYIETDSNDINIKIKHSKYSKSSISNRNETVYIHYDSDGSKITEALREFYNDIQNKKIREYYTSPKVYIYTSKENINKIKQNEKEKQNNELREEIRDLNKEILELEKENRKLENQINQKNAIINSLEE